MENLRRIREDFPHLSIRVQTPIIPGFNDPKEDVMNIIDFLKTLPGDKVESEILEYHRMGQPKYESTGRKYPLPTDLKLDLQIFGQLKNLVAAYNE